MKNLILILLEITSESHERRVLENYFLWCDLNSFDDEDCQKLLANPALFKWWHREYTNLEEKFIWRASEFRGKAEPGILREYYNETVIEIKHYYSKPLIRQARKHQPVTPQFN